MAARGRPGRSRGPRAGGMSGPGEDPRRGCKSSEEGDVYEECVGKVTEGKEFLEILRRHLTRRTRWGGGSLRSFRRPIL